MTGHGAPGNSAHETLTLFRDRAPWLIGAQAALLLVISTFVMFAPMFADGHRIMVACIFPLCAYLILLKIKKSCVEIEFRGEELRIKTAVAEHILNWQQVTEITIERKKRLIKLKTAEGEFALQKTYGKMEELMKHLEYRAAHNRIALNNIP